MPRDYAQKPARRRPSRPPIPGWVWLFSGLTVGLFVALLVYLDKQPEAKLDLPTALERSKERLQDTRDVRKDTTTAKKAPPPPPKSSGADAPRFEFYSILPELEVAVPDEELKREERQQQQRASTQPDRAVPPPADGTRYILQAGSFKQLKEADGFKARLALLGVQASIETVDINGTKWHRVRVGPFTDIKSLNQARARLHEHDIEPMVLKVKG